MLWAKPMCLPQCQHACGPGRPRLQGWRAAGLMGGLAFSRGPGHVCPVVPRPIPRPTLPVSPFGCVQVSEQDQRCCPAAATAAGDAEPLAIYSAAGPVSRLRAAAPRCSNHEHQQLRLASFFSVGRSGDCTAGHGTMLARRAHRPEPKLMRRPASQSTSGPSNHHSPVIHVYIRALRILHM